MRGLASTWRLSASLPISRIWPSEGRVGVVAEERVLALGAVDRGRLEQLPAVEDRLRVDARGAAAGRAELEEDVRGLGRGDLADAAEDRAGDDARALLERLLDEVLGVEADRGGLGLDEGGLAELRLAAGGQRVGARREGEQALLGGHRGGEDGSGGRRTARGLVRRLRLRGAGRRARRVRAVAEAGAVGLASAFGQLELVGDLRLGRLARLGRGIGLGDAAEAAVGVGVAVGVLHLDELAEALGLRRCGRCGRR